MQTLGLSGESRKTDGRLKSLLWPTVENAWDVDYLGQQGFWICLLIGLFNLALLGLIASETPGTAGRIIMLALRVASFFVYWVGGMGVREHSFAAAVLIFAIYVVGQVSSGRAPGVLSFIVAAVLLSNVRATYLASRWKSIEEGEDRPSRFNETFRDKLVDQIPPRAWPVLKIPFFIGASLLLLMLAFGAYMILTHQTARTADENRSPSVVVTPSDSQ